MRRQRRQSGMSAYDQANQAAHLREKEIRGLLDSVIETYSPGGSYLQGAEAMLGREKHRYLGSATQGLISSGLYGSTMTAGLPKKWEEEVGMPSRLKLEDMRTQGYTGALGQKASFIEGINEQVPDYATMANLTAQAHSAPQQPLSGWLAQTFGGVPNAASPKADAAQARNRAETQRWDAQQKRNLAELRARYSAPTTPSQGTQYQHTESARDKRKKAGTYLGSDGKLHKI